MKKIIFIVLLWMMILCSCKYSQNGAKNPPTQSTATTAAQKQTALPITPQPAEPINFAAQTPIVTAVPTIKPIEVVYIGNKNTKKFHLPNCRTLPLEKNRVNFYSRSEAVSCDYSPCRNCLP